MFPIPLRFNLGSAGRLDYSTDTSLGDSDLLLPTQKAVKAFVLANSGGGSGATLADNIFTGRQQINQGTITQSLPFTITQTWNNESTQFKAFVIDVTTIAADYGGTRFLSLKRNSSEVFAVDHGGSVYANGGQFVVDTNNGKVQIASSWYYSINGDVFLSRANVATWQLGLNNEANPIDQTLKSHDIITGIGSSLILGGGKGSISGGSVILATSTTDGSLINRLTVNGAGNTILSGNLYPETDNIVDLGGPYPLPRFKNTELAGYVSCQYLRIGNSSGPYIYPENFGSGQQAFRFTNFTGDDFGTLILGPKTSSFVAITCLSSKLTCRLADDSDFAWVSAKGFTADGTDGITAIYSGSGTLYFKNGILTNII